MRSHSRALSTVPQKQTAQCDKSYIYFQLSSLHGGAQLLLFDFFTHGDLKVSSLRVEPNGQSKLFVFLRDSDWSATSPCLGCCVPASALYCSNYRMQTTQRMHQMPNIHLLECFQLTTCLCFSSGYAGCMCDVFATGGLHDPLERPACTCCGSDLGPDA